MKKVVQSWDLVSLAVHMKTAKIGCCLPPSTHQTGWVLRLMNTLCHFTGYVMSSKLNLYSDWCHSSKIKLDKVPQV